MTLLLLLLLLPLLMTTNSGHAQQSVTNKGCLLHLIAQEDGGKVDFELQCPSCQAMHQLDISNCDIYEDLEVDTNCTGQDCARNYRLCDPDYSVSTPVTENGAPCSSTNNRQPLVVYILGAMLGLSLVLLAVVTIGWMRTYWAMKQKGAMAITVVQSEENRGKVENADEVDSKQEVKEMSSGPVILELRSNAAYETQSYKQAQSTTSLVSSTQNASECKDITDKECDNTSLSKEDILVQTL